MQDTIPKILVTGATGQVGGKTLALLLQDSRVRAVAGVRSAAKSRLFEAGGIETAVLDLDDPGTHAGALEGIDSLFMVTGYSVGMLLQSKMLVDSARKAGVKRIVHLGACGPDDTTVGHCGTN